MAGGKERALEMLVEVVARLGQTFDLDLLLHTIEGVVLSTLRCDRVTIFLLDREAGQLYSKVATGVGEIRFPTDRGIAGQAATTRSTIHVPDAYADPRFNPDVDRQTGYRTRNLLTLPLMGPDGEVIGVLQLLNKLDGDFSGEDLVLAQALASLCGIAIRRQMLLDEIAEKRRLERDMEIARGIQRRLLPRRAPRVAGFDLAGWNLPADRTGGDCYDFIPLEGEGERLAVLLADATGHGVGAALVAAQTRALFRVLSGSDRNLLSIARRVSDHIAGDFESDVFVTAFFGVLEPEAGRLRYLSAGHGLQFLYRARSGEVALSGSTGTPLGLPSGGRLRMAEPIEFQPGDVLTVVSDGFHEWLAEDGEEYGIDRLREVLGRTHALPAAEALQALYRDAAAFAGKAPQKDDLTAVGIRREGGRGGTAA